MSTSLTDKYPNLPFIENWEITKSIAELLGQCEAYINSISFTPIMPEHRAALQRVALIKGAQATTAIEGNNLTIEEIEKIKDGKKLQPSQKYQEIEAKNVLSALETLFKEVFIDGKCELITVDLIKRFHYMIGKDLGDQLEAIPGKFRNRNVTIGKYRAPEYEDVDQLITNFCDWLKEEFCFENGDQKISDKIVQAIIAHVYFELIHPFSDGNGRTGRLIEYYILLRGGLPDISLHLLSNHYNNTRPEYYRQIDLITQTRKVTNFLQYALVGLRDGLINTLEIIQLSQFKLTWHKLIYDKIAEAKTGNKLVSKRRKDFLLSVPFGKKFKPSDVVNINATSARLYSSISIKSIERDLMELKTLGLLKKEGSFYTPNTAIVGALIYSGKWNE